MKEPTHARIEPLEPRIAPATVIDAFHVTFTDVDGDEAHVFSSLPIFHRDLREFTFVPAGSGEQLQELRLNLDTAADGADITIQVRGGTGDGLVNVGAVRGGGVDLGIVRIEGDLSRIRAGDTDATPGLRELRVKSMGVAGFTQGEGRARDSVIFGNVELVAIAGDYANRNLRIQGEIDAIVITGSVDGASFSTIIAANHIGALTVHGNISVGDFGTGPADSIVVRGDVEGSWILSQGTGALLIGGSIAGDVRVYQIGSIRVLGDIAGGPFSDDGLLEVALADSIRIDGSILGGGLASHNGSLIAGVVGSVFVGGDLVGGEGTTSGGIEITRARKVVVEGSLIGGPGLNTGALMASETIGRVRVGGDVIGGSAPSDLLFHPLRGTGLIFSGGDIGAVEIEGSIVGGTGRSAGAIAAVGEIGFIEIRGGVSGGDGQRSGTIRAGRGIEILEIRGSLEGGAGLDSGNIRAGVDPLTGEVRDADLGRALIYGDVRGGSGQASGAIDAARHMGSLDVRGSVVGGSGDSSAQLTARTFGSVHIGQDLAGGSFSSTGKIVGNRIGTLAIDGSLRGADFFDTGVVQVEAAGSIRIGGDVGGGGGFNSGMISARRLDLLKVGGSLIGAGGERSGIIEGDVWQVLRIGGSIVGGDGRASGAVNVWQLGSATIAGGIRETRTDYAGGSLIDVAGALHAGRMTSLFIGGSISAAELPAGGAPVTSYAIFVESRVDSLRIEGALHGTPENRIGVSAGSFSLNGRSYTTNLAPILGGFGDILIRGSVEQAEISAGWAQTQRSDAGFLSRSNPDARIDSVTVGGSWTASSLTAGIDAGPDRQFGTGDDLLARPDFVPVTPEASRIGQVIIKGRVSGTAAPGDSFGFEAQRIHSVFITGQFVPLTAAKDDLQLAPATGDVRLRELPRS